ncbi:hypothetical protein L21SP5_02281 [Salinivirga cyanobacteriivorans]|uniref:Uncharacterized protein n=1 Tax=Salinivirga cyanobacteriivorans TaxID=1307839 RepID=A0A0S2I0H6_9BACT|nr:hypothetical protein L21SP5_02281 [Salinivirga cyanobacteriivorans]
MVYERNIYLQNYVYFFIIDRYYTICKFEEPVDFPIFGSY